MTDTQVTPRIGSPCRVPEPRGVNVDAARPPVVLLEQSALPAGFLDLRAGVAAALQSESGTLVVDVSGIDRLSSSTVTALLWAQRRCRARGGAVLLQGLTRQGRRMLRRTGLWQTFDLVPAEAYLRVGAAR